MRKMHIIMQNDNALMPIKTSFPVESVCMLRHKGCKKRYRFHDLGHNGHELLYVDFGKMTLKTSDSKYFLQTGDCIIVPAGQRHSIRGRGGREFDFLNLVFTGSLPEQISGRSFHLSASERQILALIKDEEGFDKPFGASMVVAMLNELVISLYRRVDLDDKIFPVCGQNRQKHQVSVVAAVLSYLQDNLSKPLDSEALACRCNLSISRLRRIVIESSGKTISQHLRTMRIELAKKLLHGSYKNIDTISHQVGYQSVGHFCNIFKRETSMTPSEYAKSLGVPPSRTDSPQ